MRITKPGIYLSQLYQTPLVFLWRVVSLIEVLQFVAAFAELRKHAVCSYEFRVSCSKFWRALEFA